VERLRGPFLLYTRYRESAKVRRAFAGVIHVNDRAEWIQFDVGSSLGRKIDPTGQRGPYGNRRRNDLLGQ
jgi:hypothetical protein